jgi:hypothetical protein
VLRRISAEEHANIFLYEPEEVSSALRITRVLKHNDAIGKRLYDYTISHESLSSWKAGRIATLKCSDTNSTASCGAMTSSASLIKQAAREKSTC